MTDFEKFIVGAIVGYTVGPALILLVLYLWIW